MLHRSILRFAVLATAFLLSGFSTNLLAAAVLWDLNGSTNGSVQDFVNAGVTEDISAETVAQVNASTSSTMTNGVVTLAYVSGSASGVFTAAANKRYPNGLLDDYLYISGSITSVTMRISGLSGVLLPNTAYRFYLFGSGDSANQQAAFTFAGVTVTTLSATAPGPTTPQDQRTAVFNFTTGPSVSNSLDFTWKKVGTNSTAGFNGFAIVPEADPDHDGLSNAEEAALGTNPNLADSDGDGAHDGHEVVEGTSPTNPGSVPAANTRLGGITAPGTVGKYLDNVLPKLSPNVTVSNWSTEPAFPNANVSALGELMGVSVEPHSNYVYAVERSGGIWRIENLTNTTVKTKILTIPVTYGDDGGLYSLAFHPDYGLPQSSFRNDCFVFYSILITNTFYYRLSRFTRDESDGMLKNEQIMIQQRSRDRGQHVGGALGFDKDGFLIVTFGDQSYNTSKYPENLPRNQWYQDAQRVDRIFQCAVLRLDVDQLGGAISTPPTRTLQGNTGPYAVPGSTQSCPPGHNFHDPQNRSGIGYYIPLDNYFVQNPPAAGVGGVSAAGIAYPAHGPALQEHQAKGERNPWRMAVDPVDGDVVFFNVGSNGSQKFEEIDRLVPGGNYGWPFAEGVLPDTSETGFNEPPGDFAPVFLGVTNRSSPRQMDPIRIYGPSEGVAIVGGVFYRGTKFPSLYGKLIYSDYISGTIWALDYKGKDPTNYVNTVLLQGISGTRQMVADPTGQEILLVNSDTLLRLTQSAVTAPEPPALLSQTGAFTNLTDLAARPGLIPYAPAAPLWSDRAAKQRWLAVPNDLGISGTNDLGSERITFSASNQWAFPKGTVFVKQFNLPLDERDPENPLLQKRLETRFLIHGEDDEYFAFTYKWNANDTDASLLPPGDVSAFAETFPIIGTNGLPYFQTWKFPSRTECMECHQAAAGRVLGLKTAQLNHHYQYPSGTNANQIATLKSLGLLGSAPSLTNLHNFITSKGISDSTATAELRVRSYLDANCSHCHRPGANAGRATFDARLTTPLALTEMINGFPGAGDLGIPDARIIRPRDPTHSVLLARDGLVDGGVLQMPPLAKTIVDQNYIAVLTDWILRIGLTNFDAYASNLGVSGGPGDDFDGDHNSSGLEFLLRMNGAVPDSQSNFNIGFDGNVVRLTVPVSGAALQDGFVPLVESSTNLLNWVPAGSPGSGMVLESNTSAPGLDGVMTWIFVPSGSTFARVGALIPPP